MKKNKITNIILIIILLVGLSLLLYPTVSNYWNSLVSTRSIASYIEQLENLDEEDYSNIIQEANQYNEDLVKYNMGNHPDEEMLSRYYKALDISGNGIMGYVEIPCIDVKLPIYHGTEEAILQVAIGHLEWSSLPVGGESTHCVISGHRGLPSAKLFTDLDMLVVGDTFMLNVLDEVLTYEVDQILIVEPHEVDELYIQEGKDLCTLITCTPYGINSHRLLVRGHRVETVNTVEAVRVTADAAQIDPMIIAPIVGIPLIVIWIIIFIGRGRRKKDDI